MPAKLKTARSILVSIGREINFVFVENNFEDVQRLAVAILTVYGAFALVRAYTHRATRA